MNYVLEVDSGQLNSAGKKAKNDIADILKNNGFKGISVKVAQQKLVRLLTNRRNVGEALSEVDSGTFVFQYPMYSRITSNRILKELAKKKNVKTVIIVHDVESLRLNKDEKDAVCKEINFFNQFNVLISHNKKMSMWLKDNGLNIPTIDLEIFDYLSPMKTFNSEFNSDVVFAGNLEKSTFLKKLNISTTLQIMGPKPDLPYVENIDYIGQFTPEEVPEHLHGKFGLVWDGTSVDTCNGIFGEYMKYNNPHKISLYLRTGVPVIIWKNAAAAEFIETNNVGIAVSSLKELDDKLHKLTEEEFQILVDNARKVGQKMQDGFYTKKALSSAIDLLV